MASQTTQRVSSARVNAASTSALNDPTTSGALDSNTHDSTSEALAAVSSIAQQATDTAKQSASYAVNMVSSQLREVLDQQVINGADIVGHVANSARIAADDLDQNVPQLAKLVRGASDRIDIVADDIRNKTAEELFHTATDFTRRQPALTFGLAAVAGFLVFRALKSSSPVETPSPSIQPGREARQKTRASHGA